jgi:hypothetical protein
MGGVFVLASVFIIGIFFVYGYMARLVRNVINGVQFPLPEWDDLGEYFTEGLKLFAVVLVYVIPVIIVACVAVIPAVILGAGGNDNETLRSLAGMSASCIWCLVSPLSLALGVWMPAALLMVVLTGDFKAGFDFSRISGFIRANAGNYILAFLVSLVAHFAAGFGFVLLCVGVFLTRFWADCVAAFAFAEVYRLSKTR